MTSVSAPVRPFFANSSNEKSSISLRVFSLSRFRRGSNIVSITVVSNPFALAEEVVFITLYQSHHWKTLLKSIRPVCKLIAPDHRIASGVPGVTVAPTIGKGVKEYANSYRCFDDNSSNFMFSWR